MVQSWTEHLVNAGSSPGASDFFPTRLNDFCILYIL